MTIRSSALRVAAVAQQLVQEGHASRRSPSVVVVVHGAAHVDASDASDATGPVPSGLAIKEKKTIE